MHQGLRIAASGNRARADSPDCVSRRTIALRFQLVRQEAHLPEPVPALAQAGRLCHIEAEALRSHLPKLIVNYHRLKPAAS